MNAFIINLSNIFDFDISMPVLCGLIADRQVWIGKDSGAFPVNPGETLVNNKLFEFSNKYEHMRITLDVSKASDTTELFLIVGYEEWDFLPYGKLSAYPLFKIQYIQNKLSELFKKPVKSLPFKIRVFLTPQAFFDRQDFFSMIEEKGFIESGSSEWFSSDLVENELTLNIGDSKAALAGKNAEEKLNGTICECIESYYTSFCERFEQFVKQQYLPRETADGWKNDFKERLDKIATIKELSEVINAPTSLLKIFLYNKFSLMAHMSNLPPIYKYGIDTSSTANGLRHKFEYTQFILQFIIDPFIEEKNRLYKVEEIEVNTIALSSILNRLHSTIGRYKKNAIDLEREVDYNIFSVNDSYYRNLPTVDNDDRNQFYSLHSIRNTLGWFYSRNKKEDILREFERKSFSQLENKIPVETGSFTSLLKEALNKQTKSIIVRMVPSEIIRFEQSRLTSPIDFRKYTVDRDRLLKEEKDKIEELMKVLPTLPFQSNVLVGIGAVILLMTLFALPIFLGLYWDNTFLFLPFFVITAIAVAGFTLAQLRRKIHNHISDLEEIRLSLAGVLAQHCNNIKSAATQMAEAFANRETLKSLKKIQQVYDNKSYQYLAYETFHAVNSESISRLHKIYGIEIHGTDTSSVNAAYDKHPEDDTNLICEFPVNDIDLVINQQQTPKKNVRTIVRKIRIKYLA